MLNNQEIIDIIFNAVESESKITKDLILHKTRKKEIKDARFIVCHYIKEYTGIPLLNIAHAVGRSDHSSAFNALKKYGHYFENESYFRNLSIKIGNVIKEEKIKAEEIAEANQTSEISIE